MPEFEEVVGAIRADDLDGAVKRLMVLAPRAGSDLHNRVITQSGRLARMAREGAEGLLTTDERRVERTRIATALLGLLREIAAAARPAPRAGGVTDAEVLTALQQLEAGAGAGEAVNGINNLKSITWLETAVRVSRSVCRVLVTSAKGSGYGSGFLIAPDRVMTNNHVIGSKKDARAARIEFNYRLALGGVGDPTVRYELDPAAFFHTSPEDELDYTVVAVRPTPGQPPPEAWGVLTLNADAVPVPRDLVPVIQHPNAQVQQVALTSSVVVRVKPPYLHYTTDTMPGSSGSPVFNDLWQVVAIHHAAGPVVGKVETNEGVLMSAIRPHLGAHWPAPPG